MGTHLPDHPILDTAEPCLSVIIPTLNEATTLPTTLQRLRAEADRPGAVPLEVIVADGGSQDDTIAIAQIHGAKVVMAQGGRGQQMNQGAAIATGNILLFLHADTRLPEGFTTLLSATLEPPGVVAAAFDLAIDDVAWGLRWVEWGVRLRSRWAQMPYGDQAIFLKAEVFHSLGGYADLPIMEDFELMGRLRRQGKIAIAPAAVATSGRRWQKLGLWRTTWINQGMVLGFLLGRDPARLAQWYRRQGKPQPAKRNP